MQAQDSFEEELITIKPRDFKCPCGKTYLSYAALFTHIKHKHDGVVNHPLSRLPARSSSLLPSTKKEEDLPSSPVRRKSQKRQLKPTFLLIVIPYSPLKHKPSAFTARPKLLMQSAK